MKTASFYGKDLSAMWLDAVSQGCIKTEFRLRQAMPGIGEAGDAVTYGVTRDNDVFRFIAWNGNEGSGQRIDCEVVDRAIEDSPDIKVQYNGYRALRPGGLIMQLGPQPDISPEAQECRLVCDNPKAQGSIVIRKPLVTVIDKERLNFAWCITYNFAPFEENGHFMVVPVIPYEGGVVYPHLLQRFTFATLQDTLTLCSRSKNLICFFNSLHAGGSVNHFHLQLVYHTKAPAIAQAEMKDERGFKVIDGYPAAGFVFPGNVAITRLAPLVGWLQGAGIPFNLFYVAGRWYLIPRNIEHEVVEEFGCNVIASFELAGKFITNDFATYESLSYDKVRAALQKTCLPPDRLLGHML